MTNQTTFDFCVCGNGMVGSVAALALAKLGFRIAWVAPEKVKPFNSDDAPDLRMSAISLGSVQLLKSIGVWEALQSMRLKPYTDLRVWELDGVETAFSASDIQQPCLGYFIENRLIQVACEDAAKNVPLITHFDSEVEQVMSVEGLSLIVLANDQTIVSKYVVGAEGAQSAVRKSAGIATRAWQYEQQAMGIIVDLEGGAGSETWQQFYPSGPRALLPMYNNYAALIWYDSAEKLNALLGLSTQQLQNAIEQAFPSCLPPIKSILGKAKFPLTRMHANEYVKGNTILIGDAAHTVNPLAGQGVNMGFGDVKAVCEVLENNEPDSLALLYGVKHKQKNRLMMTALEVIYHSFKSSSLPMQTLRNAGLFLAQRSGPAKREVIKFAAGL